MAKKKAKPVAPGTTVYKLKIALNGIAPPIYRKLEVLDCTLGDLAQILLEVMGWDGSHLHAYRNKRITYGPADLDLDYEGGDEDEDEIRVSDLVARNVKKLVFEYDFGDSWEHDLTVYKPGVAEEGAQYPRATEGARACPPEDCGGIWGYSDLVERMANPEAEEEEDEEEDLGWEGGDFDPEAFDLAEVNNRLKRYA